MEQINNKTIYWCLFLYGQWKMYIAATSKGLCYVGSPNKEKDEFTKWANTKLPEYSLVQDEEMLQSYVNEFIEYFQGQRKKFTIPVDIQGTEFQKSVWNALNEISYGTTHSYSDIAEILQKPKSVRSVATAIGANPVLITIPCHRVIGKNGSLTGYRGGIEIKRQLLALENGSSDIKEGIKHA
ncbi:methylated-DNA--[protein]-cysteine S-methyltransferase [Metabacillus arenae]|uniref:methylated-DNA--[protein]-cysteine S-methyltransferase n=1 Tax=Metabacillus arenae TaxID=2771434 RepID=A0A926S0X0_9BACI|nr:methylated-DNA--[protein]-cysteine S-methyltransferase [Metabacillus arenae]MBD1380449.1 methylated-DNA--[protein]-cysteine S-methyltransferase [Metabacillus arenae]